MPDSYPRTGGAAKQHKPIPPLRSGRMRLARLLPAAPPRVCASRQFPLRGVRIKAKSPGPGRRSARN